MLRISLLCLALLLPDLASARCSGPNFIRQISTETRNALYQEAAQTRYGEGLFYIATKDGRTAYILGTIHLPEQRNESVVAMAATYLATSTLLLVEATLEDQRDMQTYLAQNPDLMTLPGHQSLPEVLDERTWTAVADAAQSRGIPPFMAAKMRPWFLSMTLAIPPCAMAAIASGEGGVDTLLMEAAAAQNIPVASLEPWQTMLSLLSSGTFEEQLDALRFALIEPDIQLAMIVSLVEAYYSGHIAFSWHMSSYTAQWIDGVDQTALDAMIDEMEQSLLIDRNQNWIPVIEAASEEHSNLFVAFGAAHLIGDEGVLYLLEQNGWEITRYR